MVVLHGGMGKLYAIHGMSIAMLQLIQSHRVTANNRSKRTNGLLYINVYDAHVFLSIITICLPAFLVAACGSVMQHIKTQRTN